MTALNVVRLHNRVHIISDGAAIDSTGRVAHYMQKVSALPHLNAAVGIRGVRATASIIVDAITSSASSYDDLHSRVVDILRDTLAPIKVTWQEKFGPHVLAAEVVVAGLSKTKGPHAYIVATSDANATHGLPAWTPLEIGGTFFSPSNPALATDFARLQLHFDEASAIELIQRQRAIAAPSPENPTVPGPFGVGAFAQLTTVNERGIETRILKRWPDAVGDTINPGLS